MNSTTPHRKGACCSLVTVKVSQEESTKFGCFIKDANTDRMVHHAEKPEHYVSDLINCGIYLFNKETKKMFDQAREVKEKSISEELQHKPCMKFIKRSKDLDSSYLSIEHDVLKLVKNAYLYQHKGFWQQLKTTGDLLAANQRLLRFYSQYNVIYHNTQYNLLENCVLVHKSAKISPSAKLGPYVVIGAGCDIGDGVRIRDSIV